MVNNSMKAAIAALFFSILISTQAAKGAECDPDRVWVPGHKTINGVWVEGWCRPTAKTGYVWVSGHRADNGVWLSGYWMPVNPAPRGKNWVPGHRTANGRWVPGHYRGRCGPGKHWVSGHRGRRGRWISGHCR